MTDNHPDRGLYFFLSETFDSLQHHLGDIIFLQGQTDWPIEERHESKFFTQESHDNMTTWGATYWTTTLLSNDSFLEC